MNSYESIRAFARKCAALPRLDIATLSAGIMNVRQDINPSTGYEEMFQVNYLSTALLSILLLPILKKKTPSGKSGRLTLVTSGVALIAEFSERNAENLLPEFKNHENWDSAAAKKRYDTIKGLVLMLTVQLSQITKAEDTIVNVVDPTFTPGTSFFRNIPFLMRVVSWPLVTLLGDTPEGKEFMRRLLDESVQELEILEVREAVESLRTEFSA
ncbi:hypothetical protein DL765_005779 [Monosporascus sp. GIB2]|nr:hypothetical protein DL765_005779 [Monosporascus sp. GIB2]